ncbi:MAG TPA: carboxypeptidase-like regulatory domain-containing protein, partial [Flavisolibacter sp.]|nr:carboxypeptidase-like regulatory domain-containing protein [Flavisolibacter sp.]
MRKGLRLLAALFVAFIFSLSAWAQNVRLTGQITSSGENVAGVSVRVKTTSIGTTSDSTGAFQLSVPSLPVRL